MGASLHPALAALCQQASDLPEWEVAAAAGVLAHTPEVERVEIINGRLTLIYAWGEMTFRQEPGAADRQIRALDELLERRDAKPAQIAA